MCIGNPMEESISFESTTLYGSQCYKRLTDPLGLEKVGYPKIAFYTDDFKQKMKRIAEYLYRGVTDQILCTISNCTDDCVSIVPQKITIPESLENIEVSNSIYNM